jgi:amino acid adenylation domain-containing protein
VRLDLGGDPLVSEVLGRCRDTLLAGMDHSVPFERLVREIAPHREAGTNPIFQAMLVLEPPPMAPDPGWELNQVDVAVGGGAGTAKFDLHIQLEERLDGRIDGQLIYDTDLIDRDTGRRLAAHWRSLLRTIAGGHERRVSEISVLGAKERHRQLYEWNATDEPIPAGTIHALVADQARRTPDAVAAISGAEQITFARLEARAGALAGRLCRAGAAPGVLVAVAMEPSIDALVGLLAILKTGAAYLPLDLRHPTARLAFILEDAAAGILLLHSRDRGRLPHPPGTVLCVDDAVPAGAPDGEIDVEVPPDAIAYVIYTSGSTGRPKGVQVTHAAVVNLLASMAGQLHLTGHDVVVALTTQAFDIHVVETWLPLASGARIAIAPRETASDGRLLASFIDTVQATLVQATPPTWRMLLDAGWAGRDGLVAISGGETLRPELAEALLTRVDSLWNMYGPTEATVYATRARVVSGQAVTIGTPLANTRAYILDPRGEPVPVGAHGELCLGGAGVAPGYLHRPLLTAERFLADPFRPGERMYRTGDRARFLADGRIEHLGRLDQQVKIRGFRVEPGEVESELVAHPALSASVVVAADHGGGVRLVAYVVPRGDAVPAAAELRATLRDRLPDHMIPAEFVVVDHLPLNANGKLDRAALPPPRGQEGEVDAGDEPGSELERRLALLWAAGLGLPRVGVHDDFFELGGHSLLAVRLLVEVERTLGAVIPLSTLFGSGATVAGMAAWIEGSGFAVRRQATETVVPVREDGAGPILFFVHPDESALLSLRHFTGPLGGEQRLIGLLPERVDGHFDPSRDVMDLARPMLEAIRRLQPEGPYLLAGYSLGGLLAYQIAGELRDAGSRVAWLGILDAVPQKAVRRYLRSQLRAQRGERLARLARLGPQGAVRKIAERTQHRARLLAGGPGVPGEPDPLFEGFDWHGALRLASGYACSGHDIPMQLFATETLMTATGSGSLGWDEVHRGRVTVHRVPGEHLTMMMEPHVEAVADRLSRSLHHAVGRRSESAA